MLCSKQLASGSNLPLDHNGYSNGGPSRLPTGSIEPLIAALASSTLFQSAYGCADLLAHPGLFKVTDDQYNQASFANGLNRLYVRNSGHYLQFP